MKPEDWKDIAYFTPSEFVCDGVNVADKMDSQFVHKLNRIRARAGVPMHITSSHRTVEHNKAVHGAQNSAHEDVPCKAADIGKRPRPDDPHWNFSRWAIVKAAMEEGITRIGIYPDGSIHLDDTASIRPAPRLWIAVDNPA